MNDPRRERPPDQARVTGPGHRRVRLHDRVAAMHASATLRKPGTVPCARVTIASVATKAARTRTGIAIEAPRAEPSRRRAGNDAHKAATDKATMPSLATRVATVPPATRLEAGGAAAVAAVADGEAVCARDETQW